MQMIRIHDMYLAHFTKKKSTNIEFGDDNVTFSWKILPISFLIQNLWQVPSRPP